MTVHPEISPLEARIAHLKARLSHYDDAHTLVRNTLTVGDVRRTLDFALSVVSAVPRDEQEKEHARLAPSERVSSPDQRIDDRER